MDVSVSGAHLIKVLSVRDVAICSLPKSPQHEAVQHKGQRDGDGEPSQHAVRKCGGGPEERLEEIALKSIDKKRGGLCEVREGKSW